MGKEISKSPAMLEKEARIKELQQQIKKERTTLKRLQTRLKNTKQEITDIQREVSNTIFRNIEKTEALQAEVIALIKSCKKFKELGDEDREQLDIMIDELKEVNEEAMFGDLQKDNPEFEEEQRARMRDVFEQFQVKPLEEEQKNIRKVFITLSTNFHPDKARNDKERKDYHSLMQQINEAYQSGDVDKLLELEKVYLSDKVVDFSTKAVTVDMLTQIIEKLVRDLNFIKNQTKRTSSEIKALRKSELGNMLTEVNRAEKYGMGLGEMTEDMDAHLERLTELRDILQLCVEKGNMDPMHEMASKQMSLSPLDFLMEDLGISDEEFYMMNEIFDGFDDEPEPVKNPKIPVGTSVQIKKNIPYPYTTGLSLKGWQGRVSEVFKIGGKIIYAIQLDSIALKKIPKRIIKALLDDVEKFSIVELSLSDIKKAPPRDTPEEAIRTFRTILHRKNWGYLEKKENAMMQEILLKFPEKSDQENWEFWIKEHISFPISGKSRGYFNDPSGTKMKINSIHEWHESAGLLVLIDRNGIVMDHPLTDIKIDGKYQHIFELYDEWHDMEY